jgi:hypothetical protein
VQHTRFSRRAFHKASTALAIGAVFAEPLKAAVPEPSALTPALIEAARKEGKVAFYTALELPQLLQPLGVAYAKPLRPCHGKLVKISHIQVRKAHLDALARHAVSERSLFRAPLGL